VQDQSELFEKFFFVKIEGKEAKFFFKNLPRAYKDLIWVKKIPNYFNACVPLTNNVS
jgi:hypothetical protein